jgi:Ketosteroid isomerase homolog
MKKVTHIITLLIIFGRIAVAQDFQNPNLQAMVNAERAFIQMAKDQNQRDAFLFFLSDDAVTSGPGGPIIGKDQIKKQPVGNGWLFWEVAYADIAASGDFGYNTGPWEFRANKTDENPVAYGEFNSIWKKQNDGSWKNVLDIGIRHEASKEKVVLSTSQKPLTSSKKSKSNGKDELLNIEEEFMESFKQNRNAAYQKYYSDEARIVYTGTLPITAKDEKQKFLESANVPEVFETLNGETASSNDLGYVYGKGQIMVTRNDKAEKRIATYFRVWKKEDGKNWKIVLDVLSY